MSMHPNVILMAALTPHGLSRKTVKNIREANGVPDKGEESDDIKINGTDYHVMVMESAYDNDMQISAKEGDIVVYDLVTYGYGESISWAELEIQKMALEIWAKDICAKFQCDYVIKIGANHW